MSYDNRIISSEPYMVNTINTDNRISKRFNNNSLLYHNKKQDSSNEFEEALSSIPNSSKHLNNVEENSDFKNELYNLSLAKSKSKTIINKSHSNQSDSGNKDEPSSDSTKKTANSELHAKISEAMTVEVDVSTLYEKIKLLNSLKK